MINIITTRYRAAVSSVKKSARTWACNACARSNARSNDKEPAPGLSMECVASCPRLLGVDQLHIGTANMLKLDGSAAEVLELEDEITSGIIKKTSRFIALSRNGSE